MSTSTNGDNILRTKVRRSTSLH